MDFIDCNVSYGAGLTESSLAPAHDISTVSAEMERSGVSGGVAYRVEHHDTGSVLRMNRLIAKDMVESRATGRFYGLWAIAPSVTRELPAPEVAASRMRESGIIGWRLFPKNHRFMPRAFVLSDWLSVACKRRIPVFINTSHGTSLDATADLLEAYPELTVVLTYRDTTPNDRLLRPFVASFPNVYIDTSYWFVDGCIEDFVATFGASRLLYGSGFPDSYFGANMMMIRHAEISPEAKAAIAGANLRGIIEEAEL
jgi:predicted TIM-barrel fold metal-dependent hydrolase